MRKLVTSLSAAVLCAFSGVVCGQELTPVSPAQAEQALNALIPPKKKFVVINALVAYTDMKVVDLGLSCSSSSSGKTTGTVDDNGDIAARTDSSGSSDCRELHNRYYTMKLGLPDIAEPKQSAYLVTAQCVEKWVWDHCQMPEKGAMYSIVLEAGKHGTFYVYAATSEKLGAKTKVAKFAVLSMAHYKQNESK